MFEKIIGRADKKVKDAGLDVAGVDGAFYIRFHRYLPALCTLCFKLYEEKAESLLHDITALLIQFWKDRPHQLKSRDEEKIGDLPWFTDNNLTGMSLYVDRFAGNLKGVQKKLGYFEELGVNLLHLMPLMACPEEQNDGGYAVSDYKLVNPALGTLKDLMDLQKKLIQKDMYLMLDVVINHTSDQHLWAQRAKAGEKYYQDFYYMYENREIPDRFELTMPQIFPHSAPGNFTWNEECYRWIMTVFNQYQWDLNYKNPNVLLAMLEIILFYGNLGVDILRIDAPAFVWKKIGTTCQNLEEAHWILQIMKAVTAIVTPGMALLGEAIVAPKDIMKYFGNGCFDECDVAYNATQMALQWDALATSDITIMRQSQREILEKPVGTTWINYTRCHDDIGLGYSDEAISSAGFTPFQHRDFIKKYYSGQYQGTPAKGLLFAENPLTNDARISGSLASLCGLERALQHNIGYEIKESLQKILLMQAHAFFYPGIPMIFYGDELGYQNDYSFENHPSMAEDNRWVHRPLLDWKKNDLRKSVGTPEHYIFSGFQKLIGIRKKLPCLTDKANIEILAVQSRQIIAFARYTENSYVIFGFNYSAQKHVVTLEVPSEKDSWRDVWTNDEFRQISNKMEMVFNPYQFRVLLTLG